MPLSLFHRDRQRSAGSTDAEATSRRIRAPRPCDGDRLGGILDLLPVEM